MTTIKVDLKGATKMAGIAPVIGGENSVALQATKENVEVLTGVRGNPLDSAVTYRALIDQGIVELARNNINIGGGRNIEIKQIADPDDLAIPPTPTGLQANATFTEILVTWDQVLLDNFSTYSHTEIHRNTSDTIGSAIIIGTTSGGHWTDALGYNQKRYYWVRHVSRFGIKSPFHPTVNGVFATTLASVAATMTATSEAITGLPGYSALVNTTIPTLISNAGAASTQIIRSNSAPTTRGDSSALQLVDLWIDTDDNNQAYARNAANNGWEKARDSSLVTLVGSTSFTGSTVTSAISTAQSNISTVTSTANSTSTAVTNLGALVGSGNDASGNAYSASNTLIQHVNATDQNSASSLVLQTDANGSVAQMILHSNANAGSSPTSVITFRADSFAVSNNSSTDVFPFIVDGGVVFMDTARIKDGAIENAKIGSLDASKINAGSISADRIAASSLNFNKIIGNTVDVNTAQITNSAVTNAKIANASIDTAKVGSLFANTLNGDVSKAVAGSLASTVSYQNRSDTFSSAIVDLSLVKPTHVNGWNPYAAYNINKVNTEKNSWMYVCLEMAAWNVNSQGGTSSEAASSSSATSAFGSGFSGSAIVAPFLTSIGGAHSSNVITVSQYVAAEVVSGDIVFVGSEERTVTGNAIVFGARIISYSGSSFSGSPNSFGFKESISAGNVGKYSKVAEIQWVAVDTAFNDFAISGTFNSDGSAITHGVKARVRMKGQSTGADQGTLTINITSATGFLMGVR